jgi:hypothetical protein
MEEVTGGQGNCRLPFGLSPASEGQWQGQARQLASSPELTLEELVFLHHEYYSIFLLQQEASAL